MSGSAHASGETASLHVEGGVLRLSGRLDAAGAASLWHQGLAAAGQKSGLRIDASSVSYCDGAGLALLYELSRKGGGKVENLKPDFQKLLDQFSSSALDQPSGKKPRPDSIIERIGRWGTSFFGDLYEQVQFIGRMAVIALRALRHPGGIRWGDVWIIFEKVGVNAVGIVGLIGFLMGMIIAFQSAMPLKQYGADLFVINLVALAMLRELGPIMTAIVLAGRSGSAFAAELGTMKINEELNALKTMGLDDARFLVAPRMIAGIFATPLLTIYANLLGIFGGFFVMMTMGFPFETLYRQMVSQVELRDVFSGLVKAFVFGILVAGIGCLRGLQTQSGATAVGDSTTRAVVSGIILIVLCDALFAVLFYALNF